MIGLGLDAGGSSSRWLLRDEAGVELGRGTAGPLTGHIFSPVDLRETQERLRALLGEVRLVGRPDAVVAGISGYHPSADSGDQLGAIFCDSLDLERASIRLLNDMHIAYASAFEPGQGILIYAGTGSIGFHVTADGRPLRSGGHGYLIDDAGGGYWIGREGIRQVLRWADESHAPAQRPLAAAIHAALGCESWEEIVVEVYGNGRQRVAALAPAVADAASRGDEAAVAILRRSGSELARLATVLSERIGRPLPVAFAGGISRLSPILFNSLGDGLPAGTVVERVAVEPRSAAARLAVELAIELAASPANSRPH